MVDRLVLDTECVTTQVLNTQIAFTMITEFNLKSLLFSEILHFFALNFSFFCIILSRPFFFVRYVDLSQLTLIDSIKYKFWYSQFKVKPNTDVSHNYNLSLFQQLQIKNQRCSCTYAQYVNRLYFAKRLLKLDRTKTKT